VHAQHIDPAPPPSPVSRRKSFWRHVSLAAFVTGGLIVVFFLAFNWLLPLVKPTKDHPGLLDVRVLDVLSVLGARLVPPGVLLIAIGYVGILLTARRADHTPWSARTDAHALRRPDQPDPRLASIAHLYPFESKYFDLDGVNMHFLDEGAGDPIIMLHGNPTWSFFYRKLIADLRNDFRVIAPDHIGCGLSDKPQDYPYTLATHIRNVERLIEHLQLDKLTLVVHDWGGAIGCGWAVRHVDQVRRLIVLNTAAFLGGPTPWRIRVCRWPVFGDVVVRGLNGFSRAAIFMACKQPELMTPDVKRGYLLPYNSYAHRVGVLRFVRDIPVSPRVPSYAVLRDIESRLHRLRDCPMLIGWGMKDFCFTERFLEGWIDRFPEAEVHRFPHAGHYVLEDAADQLLPLTRAFLSRT
jgi:cis-3-alkyl-4-acyloxetan-2-one decarboxylase